MNSESSSSRLKRKYDTFSDSAPSKSCQGKYDVFLNFRGEDTRKGFVSHLYKALDSRGINTYKDDIGLERGEPIDQELFKAIGESRSAIVVLSPNYASSTWCLQELCHILKSFQGKDNKVFPIFYDVEPTEVRKQIGDFGKGFHNIKGKESKIEEWRKALIQISNISGWDLKKYETEAELLEIIVKEVETSVPPNDLSFISEEYVGMDVRLEEVNQLLDLRSKKVLAIGIWGMGGIGKSTIAQLIFDQIKNKFEGSSFVGNVKEILMERKGLSDIQKLILKDCLPGSSERIHCSINGKKTLRSRLSHRKVLIVLDDVNNPQELEYLIGKGDNRHLWFGEGSRIIITARDRQPLNTNGMDDIYEMKPLSSSESHQLLLLKAFNKNSTFSREEYSDALEGIVGYANGLPLALSILGSSLHQSNVNHWIDTLARLKKYPNNHIFGSLEVSFDGLDDPDMEIFLDIACFFVGESYDYVKDALRSFRSDMGFGISIRNLVNKSLITIRNEYRDRIQMHDLLSDLGQHIITRKFPSNPGKRTRVCGIDDMIHVLTNNMGTEDVEVIGHLNCMSSSSLITWNVDSLLKMPNLKCLISRYASIESREPQRPSRVLEKLTFVDLGCSTFICGSMNFSIFPNLQRLSLSECHNLCKLDQSVGCLKQLVHFDLSGSDIESLPSSISGLTCLQTLVLDDCIILEQLPESIGNLRKLVKLDAISCIALRKLPSSFIHLNSLEELDLSCCMGLQLPNSLSGLCSLKILCLDSCRLGDGAIPDDIGSLSSLEKLDLSGNVFVSIPESISQLSQLTHLLMTDCKNLMWLPKHLPLNLQTLDVTDCPLLATHLPIWVFGLPKIGSLKEYRMSKDEYLFNRINQVHNAREFETYYLNLIRENIERGHLFKIILPALQISKWNWQSTFREGCCVRTELSTSVSTPNVDGYALCVVYNVLGLDHGCSTLESTHARKKFCCDFSTDQGRLKHPLEFDMLIRKRAGLYCLVMYIPKNWFGDQLNAASYLHASVASMNIAWQMRVIACDIQIVGSGEDWSLLQEDEDSSILQEVKAWSILQEDEDSSIVQESKSFLIKCVLLTCEILLRKSGSILREIKDSSLSKDETSSLLQKSTSLLQKCTSLLQKCMSLLQSTRLSKKSWRFDFDAGRFDFDVNCFAAYFSEVMAHSESFFMSSHCVVF